MVAKKRKATKKTRLAKPAKRVFAAKKSKPVKRKPVAKPVKRKPQPKLVKRKPVTKPVKRKVAKRKPQPKPVKRKAVNRKPVKRKLQPKPVKRKPVKRKLVAKPAKPKRKLEFAPSIQSPVQERLKRTKKDRRKLKDKWKKGERGEEQKQVTGNAAYQKIVYRVTDSPPAAIERARDAVFAFGSKDSKIWSNVLARGKWFGSKVGSIPDAQAYLLADAWSYTKRVNLGEVNKDKKTTITIEVVIITPRKE